MQIPPPDVDGARETVVACVKRLRSNPSELKDKVAAFGELLAVSHIVSNVSEAVPLTDFLAVLRVFYINPTRTLRLLALKATQAFCRTPKFLTGFIRLKCDFLLARCMERGKQGEEERTQAFKTVKLFLETDAARIPKSLIQVLLSVSDAKDDPCHAISVQLLIELAIRNPRAMAKCGGMKELFRLMVDPPHEELLPILTTVFSYLLDDETTRQYVLVPHDIKVLLAPLTDTFQLDEPIPPQKPDEPPYKPPPPILGDNQSTIKRWTSCVRGVVLMMKSWSGIFIMATSGGFQSMVSALHLPSMNLHSLVLDGLLEIFRIPMPILGPDHNPFMTNASGDENGSSERGRSTTRGTEGAAGGKSTASSTTILDLPSRSKVTRHDWMLNYLSLLLVNFKRCGLFDALVRLGDKGEQTRDRKDPVADADEEEEKMNQKRRENGIKATILLGELLDLSQSTLAPAQVKELHTLPTLVRHAATFRYDNQALELTDKRVRTRAGAMVAHLQQWASMKGTEGQFLEVNTSGANKFRRIRGQNRRLDRIEEIRLKMEWDIDEQTLMSRLRATNVLATKDWNKWDFRLMGELLEGPLTNSGRIELALGTKFFKRILSFARPDSNLLFALPWSARNLRYVQVVCLAMEVLTLSDVGGAFLMKNKLMSSLAKMISDEVEYVQSKRKDDNDRPLSPEKMVRTMVKEYFTLIGTLSGSARGISILNETKIFSLLVPLISSGRSDLCKVIMTSMDYSQAGSSRVLLSKVLQNKTMPIRYLATRHLHFLLRAGAGDFKSWGIEFACKSLKDPESRIVRAIVALLDEASDDPEMLNSFIARKPEMLLEGDHPGKFLVYRFLSTDRGFEYLNQTDFIERELDLWAEKELSAYVLDVEAKLMETVFSDSYKQKDTTSEGGVVNMMPHLYGELAKTENGFDILKHNNHFVKTMDSIKKADKLIDIERRAALWAAAHVGASPLGLAYLTERGVLEALLDLTVTSPCLSTRGTCLMALGLLGSTEEGRDVLIKSGWSQPHAEVYRLVAVPSEPTCRLLMQVPQPFYTGGSWTPNFNDADLVKGVIKSARNEMIKSARGIRAEAAAATVFQGTVQHVELPPELDTDDTAIPVVDDVSSPRPSAGRAIGRGLGRGRPMTKDLGAPTEEAPAPPSKGVGRGVPRRPSPPPSAGAGATSPRTRGARRSESGAPSKPLPAVGGDKKSPLPARSNTAGSSSIPKLNVPPLAKLQEALDKSEFDPNPLKDNMTEDQKTILKLIVDMTSHITTEKALRALKKMRMGTPELFLNPETFLAALKLLEMYRFKLMIRRFVYELFGECIITAEQFQSIWDEDVMEGRNASPVRRPSTAGSASPRRVGLRKDLPRPESPRKSPKVVVRAPAAPKAAAEEEGGDWM